MKKFFKILKECFAPIFICVFSIITFNIYRTYPLKYPHHKCPPETAYSIYFYMLSILLTIHAFYLAKKSKNNERICFVGYGILCFYNFLDEIISRNTVFKLDEYYYLAAIVLTTIGIIIYKNRKPA